MASRHSGHHSRGVRFGEYTSPYLATVHARYQFLQAVRRRCPLPLLQLRSRIFPVYSRWAEDFMADARAREEWNQSAEAAEMRREMVGIFKHLGLTEAGARFAAEGRPVVGVDAEDAVFHYFMIFEEYAPRLARLLMRWAQRHNLTHQREFEEGSRQSNERPIQAGEGTAISELTEVTLHTDYWACEWALLTLGIWKFSPDGAQLMNANPPKWVHAFGNSSSLSDEPPFRVRPGWDGLSETEPTFRERVQAALNTYIEGQRRLSEARGLIGTAEKRRPVHFDWLALYQVKEWSWSQIADWDQEQTGENTKGEDVIRKGAGSAAKLCELNPRAGRPGRPRSRKE